LKNPVYTLTAGFCHAFSPVTAVLHESHHLTLTDLTGPQARTHLSHVGLERASLRNALGPDHIELRDLIVRQLETLPHGHDRLDPGVLPHSWSAFTPPILRLDVEATEGQQNSESHRRPQYRLHRTVHPLRTQVPAS
jgi:hypothetical protein